MCSPFSFFLFSLVIVLFLSTVIDPPKPFSGQPQQGQKFQKQRQRQHRDQGTYAFNCPDVTNVGIAANSYVSSLIYPSPPNTKWDIQYDGPSSEYANNYWTWIETDNTPDGATINCVYTAKSGQLIFFATLNQTYSGGCAKLWPYSTLPTSLRYCDQSWSLCVWNVTTCY